MAITVRGTSIGGSANSTTAGAIALPAGVAIGDVSIIAWIQNVGTYGTSALPTLTPPAGWTVLCNAGGVAVAWRVFQSGDATSGIVATSTLTNWWESLCISYTGCDTTSPIDASCFDYAYGITAAPPQCRAPSVNPNWNGSQLLCVYCEGGSTGRTIALPGGLTARTLTATGPNLRMADKALTDGTPTGTFDATVAGTAAELYFGMSIALKASGATAATLAAAQPVVAGSMNHNFNTTTPYTLPLDRLNVQNGDMVVLALAGADTVASAPTGYTQQSSQQGAILYTHVWATGDTTAPSFSWSNIGGTPSRTICVALVRKQGVSANPLSMDQIAVNTASATTAVTVTSTTQTPANATEVLVLFFGSASGTVGSWSAITAGLTSESIVTTGPGLRLGWVQPAATPTGTFAATWTIASGAVTLADAALLVQVGATVVGGTQQARAMVLA